MISQSQTDLARSGHARPMDQIFVAMRKDFELSTVWDGDFMASFSVATTKDRGCPQVE